MRPTRVAAVLAACAGALAALALEGGTSGPVRTGTDREARDQPIALTRLSIETRRAALARRAERLARERAEPTWQEQCRADPTCVAWQEEQRAALAAVIPSRRAAFDAIIESDEAQEAIRHRIARNAAALGVDAEIDDLFVMLSREYWLAIEADDCAARQDASPPCEATRAELDSAREDFEVRTGITMTALRAGQHEATREETVAMQAMAERQGGALYFARDRAAGEVAPRLIGEEEAGELQAAAQSCPIP